MQFQYNAVNFLPNLLQIHCYWMKCVLFALIAQWPPHSLPVRVRYEVSIVSLISNLYSTSVTAGLYGITSPDSKVYGANMGPIWGWQDPGGPHVGPMNLAIWALVLNPLTAARLQKMALKQYRNNFYGNKTVSQTYYLYIGNPCLWKNSLYIKSPLFSCWIDFLYATVPVVI